MREKKGGQCGGDGRDLGSRYLDSDVTPERVRQLLQPLSLPNSTSVSSRSPTCPPPPAPHARAPAVGQKRTPACSPQSTLVRDEWLPDAWHPTGP